MMHDFICPLCGAKFIRDDKIVKCENGHCFDIAKQGYVNLVPSGRLPGHIHGDNKEMVRARRDFLNAGYYTPLAESLSDIFKKYVPENGCILDCGCGEGFYSSYISEKLVSQNIDVLATDISRDAVAYAAKRGGIRCAVANTFRLPVESNGCDAILSICAPISPDEFLRILKVGGYSVIVVPANRHLWNLKSAVYLSPYENEHELLPLPGFQLKEKVNISFAVEIDNAEQIRNLFTMTPYAYNSNREDQMRLMKLDKLSDNAEFSIFVFEKKQEV